MRSLLTRGQGMSMILSFKVRTMKTSLQIDASVRSPSHPGHQMEGYYCPDWTSLGMVVSIMTFVAYEGRCVGQRCHLRRLRRSLRQVAGRFNPQRAKPSVYTASWCIHLHPMQILRRNARSDGCHSSPHCATSVNTFVERPLAYLSYLLSASPCHEFGDTSSLLAKQR